MAKQPILFREQQRFRQFWLWVVVLGVAAIFWVGFAYQLFEGQAPGSNPVTIAEAIILLVLVGVGLPLFFYSMKLTTKVYPGMLTIKFSPFHLKAVRVPLHLLRNYEYVAYNPIYDYGGWGIRWTSNGKAYTTSGNEGVQLYFYNQKPILLGSQRADELYEAIHQAKQMKSEV